MLCKNKLNIKKRTRETKQVNYKRQSKVHIFIERKTLICQNPPLDVS